MFAADYQDGSLEQLVLSPQPMVLLVAGKIIAHWVVCGLPLVVLAPVIGIQFDLDASSLSVLMATLLIGTGL
jgi:heme exporter protein B